MWLTEWFVSVATAKGNSTLFFFPFNRLTRQFEFRLLVSKERFMRLAALTFSLVFLAESSIGTPNSRAQELSATGQVAEADKAYQAKDWNRAATLYGQLTTAQANNGRFWYRLGISLHGTGSNDKALAAFQKALENGVPPAYGDYGKAIAYLGMKNKKEALAALDRAAQGGSISPEMLSADEDLASLRTDEGFTKLLAQAKHYQAPCTDTAENRQFDFWIGEWDVVSTITETPAGNSKIELILGSCVIQENWTGGLGHAGKSYNTFNPNLKRWEQFWVDDTAGMIHFYGNLKNGVMDYWTDEIPQPDATKLKRHLQFIPQGADQVRQFSQGSTDGGKTWTVEYDLTYHRKK